MAHLRPKIGQLKQQKQVQTKNHDAELDIITINQIMHYQRNRMNQNRDISQNPIFWPILALKWANESPKNFEQTKKSQLTVKHHCNQSKYAISEESNEPN